MSENQFEDMGDVKPALDVLLRVHADFSEGDTSATQAMVDVAKRALAAEIRAHVARRAAPPRAPLIVVAAPVTPKLRDGTGHTLDDVQADVCALMASTAVGWRITAVQRATIMRLCEALTGATEGCDSDRPGAAR